MEYNQIFESSKMEFLELAFQKPTPQIINAKCKKCGEIFLRAKERQWLAHWVKREKSNKRRIQKKDLYLMAQQRYG